MSRLAWTMETMGLETSTASRLSLKSDFGPVCSTWRDAAHEQPTAGSPNVPSCLLASHQRRRRTGCDLLPLGLGTSAVLKHQLVVTDSDHVTVGENLALDALPQVLDAIRRSEINDAVLRTIEFNHGVLPRDVGIFDLELA